jgi:HK97 family phage prohead protease/HK97 family phage major capsid protein
MKDKVLRLSSAFTTKAAEGEDALYIEGYASTVDIDRQGDVVPSSVWEKGLQNYLKNPVILAYHDHNKPIGRMTGHKVDSKGLWIKARISAAAEIYKLIKDDIITAFSIGFRVIDAEYNSVAEAFLIKDLELVEISVVSVPANQNTLFQLSKAFESTEEYESFKKQFVPEAKSAKGLESAGDTNSTSQKEWKMDPKELQQMLADAAKTAAEEATKAMLAQQKAQEEKKLEEARAQAELEAKVKAIVDSKITVGESGAEKLLKEVTARFEAQAEEQKSALAGLESALKEKAAEIARIQSSKMTFGDKADGSAVSYDEKEKAVLLSKVTRKSIEDTKFGSQLLTKYNGSQPGAHIPGAVPWEQEVSLRMEEEVRRRLVMAPLMRNIAMQTNVMKMPLNPEAGYAQWVAGTDFGNANNNSSGNTAIHALKEITLSAFKVATREYMAYEEEEDSLLAVLPVVRDAMVRRVAKTVDRAYIRGQATAGDPLKGVAEFDASSVVTVAANAAVSIANMRALRKDLGAWGIDPSQLVYVVNTEIYYNLLDDTNFLTTDKVGDRATILTGQIGSIGNTPVIVSAEFADVAEDAIGAFCFHPGNFLVGNQRGLRVDTDDLVERQARVLVASLRTGLTQMTTNLGQAVSTLRYSATV